MNMFNIISLISMFICFSGLSLSAMKNKEEFVFEKPVGHLMITSRIHEVCPIVRDLSDLACRNKKLFSVDKNLEGSGVLSLDARLKTTLNFLKSDKSEKLDLMLFWNSILNENLYKNIKIHYGIRNTYKMIINPIYQFLLNHLDTEKISQKAGLMIITLLMLRGADPDQQNNKHFSPLFLLPRLKDQDFALKCADLFYLWGARFNIPTPLGYTPLHEAFLYERGSLIKKFKKFRMATINSPVYGSPESMFANKGEH